MVAVSLKKTEGGETAVMCERTRATREQVADKSGVAVSNITRFEQKGLISLKNLIGIAIALEYTSEIKNVFSQPKYSTMEELQQIKRNANKKKAYRQ